MTTTPYGRVFTNRNGVAIYASHAELWSWAHRPGAAWPCSTLEKYDVVRVTFRPSGLAALLAEFDGMTCDEVDIDGPELTAWASDVLRDVLPKDHPAYFVTVGQFDEVSS